MLSVLPPCHDCGVCPLPSHAALAVALDAHYVEHDTYAMFEKVRCMVLIASRQVDGLHF
jgi:hypothetical protein